MSKGKRSVWLALLLRHKPEQANLTLDKEGWVTMEQLTTNTDFTEPELREIVKADEKGRYSIAESPTRIRANQGHSTKVDLTFKSVVPPVVLYHGTPVDACVVIKREGLKPMSRHHVHLSGDTETAAKVGGRRGKFAVLVIDAKSMLSDGLKFFISDNGVYLVDHVPPKYITFP
jgi:putative RNA 2'-phosphotransferase